MNQKRRRIFLCIALSFFLILTPCILCYSWGYTIDWENKRLALTGGFYFKSTPKKAEIYINDQFKKNTPALVKRLAPKKYQVEIKKENYYSWLKNLTIRAELITEARNILLIPKQIQTKKELTSLPVNFKLEEYLPQDKNQTTYYLQKQSGIIYKTDQENNFYEQINLSPLPKEQEYQLISQKDQIAALSEQGDLYLFNHQKQNFELISQDIKQAQFSQNQNKLLYYSNSEIWVYYLANDLTQPQKQAGEKELITRLSQEIKQAIWYFPTNYHILILLPDKLQITELDNRYPRNTYTLIKDSIQEIACHPEEKKIYLLFKDQLKTIQIEEK